MIDHRARFFYRTLFSEVFHDANDLDVYPWITSDRPSETTADRRRLREESSSQALVDYRHFRRCCCVLWAELPSLQEREAHGLEETRADGVIISFSLTHTVLAGATGRDR